MFRWISSKIFGGNQTEKETKDESFEDAVEVLETDVGNSGGSEISENINNSAVVGDETEDNTENLSKPDNSATKTDTSVWENVEISQTEVPGDAQNDETDKESSRTMDGVQTEKSETTEKEKASKPQEEPEDILTLVTRLSAEGNLVRAKKLIYGLGHLKGIDNKEIDSHIMKQYEIAVKKNSHGWIRDARYFAEVMYSRQWIDKNLPTLHQRNRNRDRDREQNRQERRRKENEAPPQEEHQSRFTGMCQDVRLLSNPDLPVVRSNAATKQPENIDTNKANVNESNRSKQNTKHEEKEVTETKEKLQNFNQMKSAIEDIISRRAERGPKITRSEESGHQQRPKQQKVEEESSGIIVKAVTDKDQIIQSVDVCMPTLSSSEGQEVMENQSNDESEIKMKTDNSTDDLQIKECVVKLERLPGYYHVQSPKVKSPDAINKSLNVSEECKSPVGRAKSKGTPKRKLSGNSKKPWVNGDEGMEIEESDEDRNYVRWIGNDNGCKMTVSSDDLKVDDDCIISYGKPVNKPDVLADPSSPDIQNFVENILGKVCSDVSVTSDHRCVENGDSANVQNMIDTDGATMDIRDKDGSVDQHLYQDQFVNFCQQSTSTDGAGDNSTSNELPSFQSEYLQFCQTKSD